MSIVTPHLAGDLGDGCAESAQLDVVVLHARDAEGAAAGGADRLLLSSDPEDGHYSPEPAVVSAVVRETDVPVWVVLRTRDGHFGRLVSLGASFIELGAVTPPMKLHDVITPSTGTTNWLFGETPWNQLVFWLQALPAGLIVWPI